MCVSECLCVCLCLYSVVWVWVSVLLFMYPLWCVMRILFNSQVPIGCSVGEWADNLHSPAHISINAKNSTGTAATIVAKEKSFNLKGSAVGLLSKEIFALVKYRSVQSAMFWSPFLTQLLTDLQCRSRILLKRAPYHTEQLSSPFLLHCDPPQSHGMSLSFYLHFR